DISPALVEAARSRLGVDNRNITFEVADVSLVPPPAQRFDRLVSRFGIMFFANPLATFSNLASWLAPEGRFAFAVWASPAENPWMTYVREVVNEVAELPPPEPDAPGPFRYGDVDQLLNLLQQAGFGHLNSVKWDGLLPVGGGLSATEAAQFALSSFSIAEPLAEVGETVAEQVQQNLASRYGQYAQNDIVMMPACVHLVTGGLQA
ncbi:MAG: class I SAM-dependent methyltransferase, partial [Cyanobacteria bacterium P01_F01_bin.42]